MDFPVSISVVMPTYNTDTQILKEAVESILNQTFRDFEFIIIDDGTTNDSEEYLNDISDDRVRIIRNPSNIGITRSLNIGIAEAKGKYIARMDADDVSLPARLEKEYAFMEANPDVIVCGGQERALVNGEEKKASGNHIKHEDMESYRVRMLFINPGPIHPTAMLRHDMLIENHIAYNENLIYAQDYGMWESTSHYGRICILDEVMIYRRKHAGQISIARKDVQLKCDKMTQKKMLTDLLGEVTDEEVDLHYRYSTGYYPELQICPEIEKWYDRLVEANKTAGIYDQKKLEKGIINIKKRLIRQSFTKDMSKMDKLRMIFKHIPFGDGLHMIAGNIKRGIW